MVDAVKTRVLEEREEFDKTTQPLLNQQLEELKRLRGKQVHQLELALDRSRQDDHFKESKKNQQMKRIEEIFSSYQHWVEDTMQTEPAPYIQLMAVLASTLSR